MSNVITSPYNPKVTVELSQNELDEKVTCDERLSTALALFLECRTPNTEAQLKAFLNFAIHIKRLKKHAITFLAAGSVAAASILTADLAGLNIYALLAKELSETAFPALNDPLQRMGIDPLQLSPELSSALSITTLVLGSAVIAGLTTKIYQVAKGIQIAEMRVI